MIIDAIVEMPMDTKYKYEYKNGLYIDRVLNRRIPFNYGFVPGTKSKDGDPLDVFILSCDPITPLTKVKVDILYGIKCTDQGEEDNKLVGLLVGDFNQPFSYEPIYQYLVNYKPGFEVLRQTEYKEAIFMYRSAKL